MKAGKQRLNLRKKKNLRTSYMENIGMNVLKKKSGDKNLQLKKDSLLAKSVQIKGNEILKLNSNNSDILDHLEETNEVIKE